MMAAFALLLQALFAVPLALRMTADAMQWVQLGASICAATTADDQRRMITAQFTNYRRTTTPNA